MLAKNKNPRGGIGSNQYTVKDPSGLLDDSSLSDRVTAMRNKMSVPSSFSSNDSRSTNPDLEGRVRKLRLEEQRNPNSDEARATRRAIYESYPTSYASAIVDAEHSSRSNAVFADAIGDDELDEDELTNAIYAHRQSQDDGVGVDQGMRKDQSRFQALLVASRRDSEVMDQYSDEIHALRRKMNVSVMARFAF